MMTAFLQYAFRHFRGDFGAWHKQAVSHQDSGLLRRAVEHVVDETSSRLRVIPGYRRRLEGPVADTFLYIDTLVERMPGAFMCSRTAFGSDPRVKAFFVSPRHMQEVFSESKDVRTLFDSHPQAKECCALVCMHMEERRKFGVALVGDSVHREVMQTTVSFMQHQLYSPGISEADARRALKCCIFNSILNTIRQRFADARACEMERRKQLVSLRNQLREAIRQGASVGQQARLEKRMEALACSPGNGNPLPQTLEEQLAFILDVLRNPARCVSAGFQRLRLTHMGVRVGEESKEPAYELDIAKIHVASREPRVAALVRFPRSELLPRPALQLHAGSLFPA